MKKKNTICYVAGSSGGHIIPCLTLAQEHKQEYPEDTILFFTSDGILDIEILSKSNMADWHIPLSLNKMKCDTWYDPIVLSIRFLATFIKSFFNLIRHRPKKVVATGGYLCIPVIVCARILAIPVELYELNVQPGKATQFLASWSIKIRTCFEKTAEYLPKKKCIQSAYPIRFFGADAQMSQKDALELLQFDNKRKTILILGGSQGSLEINKLFKSWLIEHPHFYSRIQVIHQTGRKETFNWQRFYAEHGIPAEVFSFKEYLAPSYAAADLILCRSGAGTLFEILFFGKPCITIPLITPTNSHQLLNAQTMHEEYGEQFKVITAQQLDHSNGLFFNSMNTMLDFNYLNQQKGFLTDQNNLIH